MSRRDEPLGGYASGQKQHYRREVWAFIERSLRRGARSGYGETLASRAQRRVLILESSRGAEVEELLRRGYNSSCIHVVNESPAIAATVQRRYRGDRRMRGSFQTYGKDLDTALGELHRAGRLFDAMNLDFTACLSEDLLATIGRAAALMKPGGAFVVTVQRGRERGKMGSWLTSPGDGDPHRPDALRVAAITWATSAADCPPEQMGCRWHFGPSTWGVYKGDNSHVSMLWVGMTLIPHASAFAEVWETTSHFGPRCGLDALERRHLKMAPDLFMFYHWFDGQGARCFFRAPDLQSATAALAEYVGSPPEILVARPTAIAH